MDWKHKSGLWNKARQDVTSCWKCISLQQKEHHQRTDGGRERDPTLLSSPSCTPIFSFNHSYLQVWLTASLRFPVSLPLPLFPCFPACSLAHPRFHGLSMHPSVFPLSFTSRPYPVMRLKAKFTKDRQMLCVSVSGQMCVQTQARYVLTQRSFRQLHTAE